VIDISSGQASVESTPGTPEHTFADAFPVGSGEPFDPFTDFFSMDENEFQPGKDWNVAVYMVSWAAKKGKLGEGCDQCHFDWENEDDSPRIEETLHKEKWYGTISDRLYSYRKRLNSSMRTFCEHVIVMFKVAIRETLTSNGMKVCENIMSRILFDSITSEWVNRCGNSNCKIKKQHMEEGSISQIVWVN